MQRSGTDTAAQQETEAMGVRLRVGAMESEQMMGNRIRPGRCNWI